MTTPQTPDTPQSPDREPVYFGPCAKCQQVHGGWEACPTPQSPVPGGETPTTEIRFEGGSDDLCEVIGSVKGCDEYDNCANHDGRHAFAFIVRNRLDRDDDNAPAVRVNALYDGCWSFAVGLIEEGAALPDWGYRLELAHPYSTALILTVPVTAEVVRDSLNY